MRPRSHKRARQRGRTARVVLESHSEARPHVTTWLVCSLAHGYVWLLSCGRLSCGQLACGQHSCRHLSAMCGSGHVVSCRVSHAACEQRVVSSRERMWSTHVVSSVSACGQRTGTRLVVCSRRSLMRPQNPRSAPSAPR